MGEVINEGSVKTWQGDLPLRGHLRVLKWELDGVMTRSDWFSQSGFAGASGTAVAGDDSLTADAALRILRSGTAIVWQGDFQNARQLLSALSRRINKKRRSPTRNLSEAFRRHRLERNTLAELLGRVLIPLSGSYEILLRRAPDVAIACAEAYGPASGSSLVSLRELQGVVGAHEWRQKGVAVAALDASIHPYYGVFSPIRGEYLDLVAAAPLPREAKIAFDVGTGTGVLAAILAKRGVTSVVATDQDGRAIACAAANLNALGFGAVTEVVQTDLFAAGRADVIVCNPPWIPATPVSALDYAVYDSNSDMLKRFLYGAPEHLTEHGEVWLVISDLAELLGLRSRTMLLDLFEDAGLEVLDRLETPPTHRRASDTTDPLHAARSAESTSLWRLGAKKSDHTSAPL